MNPIHFGPFMRSPDVTRGQNRAFFINLVPRYHSTAFAFHIWLPISYWVINVSVMLNPIYFGTFRRSPEVTRGQIWPVFINFAPRYLSTAFAIHIWFPIFYLVITVFVIIIPIHFGLFMRSPEVTRGQIWPVFINFAPRYHSTAFAIHIWVSIFYLVIKVFVTMNPIHFGSFMRSPEVTRGQNWPFFINLVPRYHSTAFAFPIWLPISYWVIRVLVIINPIHFGTFQRSPGVKFGPFSSILCLVTIPQPLLLAFGL